MRLLEVGFEGWAICKTAVEKLATTMLKNVESKKKKKKRR